MTERMALGAPDAESRWIGIRRHQAVLVVIGTGLVGDWLTRSGGRPLELAGGLVTLAAALPTPDGVTVFELAMIGFGFLARRRWTRVGVHVDESGARVRGRGDAVVHGYELAHRGRLDLSGTDMVLVDALAALADGLSTAQGTRHFSIHVRVEIDETTTVLALPPGTEAPDGWHRHDDVVGEILDGARTGWTWRLEAWRHLRDTRGVLQVLRVEDFSGAPADRGVLERLQHASSWSEMALHVEVIGGPRAHRVASRAVHGTGSDVAASSSVGFRRTARTTRAMARLNQREALVASGRALLRLGVYVVVRAPSTGRLKESVGDFERSARAAGLRCRRGGGRQAAWYCQQLPGGLGW